MKDGTVDAIVTDHAPHNDFEKNAEFELAPFGMIGLETALSLVITNLVAPGVISWERAVELMAVNPARSFASSAWPSSRARRPTSRS